MLTRDFLAALVAAAIAYYGLVNQELSSVELRLAFVEPLAANIRKFVQFCNLVDTSIDMDAAESGADSSSYRCRMRESFDPEFKRLLNEKDKIEKKMEKL